MSKGYIYLLINYEFNDLVKFGSTFKRPEIRVKEIQNVTGVPGKYELWHWWQMDNPTHYLAEIFKSLATFHSNGEFFKLQPYQAKSKVDALLGKWEVPDVFTMVDEHYSDPDNFQHTLKNYLRLRGKRYNQKIIDEMEENIAKYGHLYGVSLEDLKSGKVS